MTGAALVPGHIQESEDGVERSSELQGPIPPWVAKLPIRTATQVRTHERLARLRDLGLVLVTSPLWLPVVGLIAAVVKLQDPTAPVVFRQQRVGRDGKRFPMLKFRTMVNNAESLKKDLLHLNELEWPDFKITNDPRVTRIGRILRMLSLDELPQLFNVLSGDMGLVGPRPTSFGIEAYEPWHTARVDLRPGLTGLWQVVGRANLHWEERVRLELAYQKRCCWTLDFKILSHTIGAVVNRSGT